MGIRVWHLAVKKDPLGIGFNNIGYVYDSKTKKQLAGIRVLPIDINNDGKITPDENFYDSMDDLITAIANGKYPSPPARELYFVTNGKPQKELVIKFLNWVLTDGQKYVNESGYITLSKEKVAGELKRIQIRLMRKIRLVKDITARHFMLGIAVFTILFLLVIGFSLFFKALPIMKEKNLWVLLTSANWKPFKGDFGFLPYIVSTVYVSLIAIIIALPLSILTSIFLNSYASKSIRRFLSR